MSNEVVDLVEAIKTRTSTVLGSDYKPIGYAIDIEKNPSKGSNKRFGVVVGSLGQTEEYGVLSSYTVMQEFTVKITNSYSQSKVNDSDKLAKTNVLFDLALSVYTDLVKEKAGLPSVVVIVGDMTVSDPEYLEEDNVVVLNMSFAVTYRKTLL